MIKQGLLGKRDQAARKAMQVPKAELKGEGLGRTGQLALKDMASQQAEGRGRREGPKAKEPTEVQKGEGPGRTDQLALKDMASPQAEGLGSLGRTAADRKVLKGRGAGNLDPGKKEDRLGRKVPVLGSIDHTGLQRSEGQGQGEREVRPSFGRRDRDYENRESRGHYTKPTEGRGPSSLRPRRPYDRSRPQSGPSREYKPYKRRKRI